MSSDAVSLVRAFLAEHTPPMRIWAAPRAMADLASTLPSALPSGAEVVAVPGEYPGPGPAVLLATQDDLQGPHRDSLLALAKAARPSRPVICGGTGHRDRILDAINTWHVGHLLSAKPSAPELSDALLRVHRSAILEHVGLRCAEQIHARCRDLERSQQKLERTQARLLHAERLTAVAGFECALALRLQEHLACLADLHGALEAVPVEERSARLVGLSVESIQGIQELLSQLLDATGGPR